MKSDSIQRHRARLLSHAQHLRALLGIILATCACMLALTPAPAYAAPRVISKATVADSATNEGKADPIDITKDDQRAANINSTLWIGYNTPHSIHVELRGMSSAGSNLNRTVEVKLAQGLSWITDTSNALAQNLDTTKGDKGITRTPLPKLDDKYDLAGGTRTYHLADGVTDLDIDLDYSVDTLFLSKTNTPINNAITINVRENGQSIDSVTLKQAFNNIVNYSQADFASGWYDPTSAEATEDGSAFKATNAITLKTSGHPRAALAEACVATFHVDDLRAKVVPSSIHGTTWDTSAAASEGIYRLNAQYTPNDTGAIIWQKSMTDPMKFSVEMPTGTGRFKVGDVVHVDAHYEVKGYDVDGSKTSLSWQDKRYTITATETKSIIYLNSGDPENPVQDRPKCDWRLYNGEGVVAYHTLSSNKTEQNKTIEQRFDREGHVYAVFIMDSAGSKTVVGRQITVGWVPDGETQEYRKTVTIAEDSINATTRYRASENRLKDGTMLSFADFGLSANDSITYLSYTIDIPPIQDVPLYALGKIYSYDTALKNTIEVYHVDPTTKKRVSTGVATSTHIPHHGVAMRPHYKTNTVVNAGERVTNINLDNNHGGEMLPHWASWAGQSDPIYYVVIRLKDGNGNYLKIARPKLVSSDVTVYSLTEEMYEERVVEGLGRIYTFDTLAISAMLPDKPLFNSRYGFVLANKEGKIASYPWTRLSYEIDVPRNAPAQSQKFMTLHYVEDRYYDDTVPMVGVNNINLDYLKVNLVELGISNRIHPSGRPYHATFGDHIAYGQESEIIVRASPDLSVETSAKHHSASEYTSWAEGDDPIAVGTKSSFDLKVDVIQGSGQELANKTYVYIPIPKENQNWGGMQKGKLEFNMTINSTPTQSGKTLATSKWRAEYGTITPTDNGDALAAAGWSTNFNGNANCVRITIDSLPANNTEVGPDVYSFILNCSVDQNVNKEDAINTFCPRYYRDLGEGNRGFHFGSFVSLQSALGEVRGALFEDRNKNGKLDSGEELAREGVEVSVHKGGEEVAKTTTNAQGEYYFYDLNSTQVYLLRAKNPATNTYVFGRPGTPNAKGQDGNNENQFIGQANNTYGQTLSVYPMKPVGSNPTAATYNIGLMDKNAKTKFTFEAGAGKIKKNNQATYSVSGVPTASVADPLAERAGYTYYWYKKGDASKTRVSIPNTFGYDDTTFVAEWQAVANTPYTIEWYQQAEDGTWGDAYETRTRFGATDQDVELTGADITAPTGFALDASKSTTSGKIAGDGKTTFKVYYKRQFSVTFKQGDHGAWENASVSAGANFDHGATTPAPPADYKAAQAGWEFDGWKADGENNKINDLSKTKVTRNITYTAQWKGKTDTKYLVKKFYQLETGGYPDDVAAETRTGVATGAEAKATTNDLKPAREGYILDDAAAQVHTVTVTGDGQATLKIYFRLAFSVTYNPGDHGAWEAVTHKDLRYNAPRPAEPNNYSQGKQGWTFSGWDYAFRDPVTMSITYTAQWVGNDETPYKVQYIYPDEELNREITLSGKAGDTAKINEETDTVSQDEKYAWDKGNQNEVLSAEIQGDGSTVLKVYFKRVYKVTYAPGEAGLFEEETHKGLDKGTQTPAFTGDTKNAKAGYEFLGWDPQVADTVEDDVTYTATWKANKASYKVELYYMKKYGIWPTKPQKTLELEGMVDQEVSFNPATQTRFTDTTWEAALRSKKTYKQSKYKKSTLKGTVAGDGSLVLKAYYDIASGPDPCFPDVTHRKNSKGEYIDWFCNVVHDVNDMGLITGYDNGEYGPRDRITRAQIIVILWRMSGTPSASVTPFTDVERYMEDGVTENYYWMALQWGKATGVASGYDNGTFKPRGNVTREELATFLRNYALKVKKISTPGSAADYSRMTDKGKVSKYARPTVGWCFRNTILEGTKDTQEIKPQGKATRGDAAKMFLRFYELLEKE